MMKDLPACRECKRTHTMKGDPIRLRVKGDNAGLCKTCASDRAVRPESLLCPGVESDTRALEYWLNTVYRRRRRVNGTLTP